MTASAPATPSGTSASVPRPRGSLAEGPPGTVTRTWPRSPSPGSGADPTAIRVEVADGAGEGQESSPRLTGAVTGPPTGASDVDPTPATRSTLSAGRKSSTATAARTTTSSAGSNPLVGYRRCAFSALRRGPVLERVTDGTSGSVGQARPRRPGRTPVRPAACPDQ